MAENNVPKLIINDNQCEYHYKNIDVVGSDIHDVAEYLSASSLYYPYKIDEDNYLSEEAKKLNWVSHVHRFEDVLAKVLKHPLTFSIEGFEEYYSVSEIEMINKIIQKFKETN